MTRKTESNARGWIILVLLIVGLSVAGLILLLWGVPQYNVYSARMAGQAILAKAQAAKQAQIVDAEAKLESAKYLKQAAVEIQSSLSPQYLRYLEIQMQEVVGEHGAATYFYSGVAPTPVIQPKGKTAE